MDRGCHGKKGTSSLKPKTERKSGGVSKRMRLRKRPLGWPRARQTEIWGLKKKSPVAHQKRKGNEWANALGARTVKGGRKLRIGKGEKHRSPARGLNVRTAKKGGKSLPKTGKCFQKIQLKKGKTPKIRGKRINGNMTGGRAWSGKRGSKRKPSRKVKER